MIKQTRIKNVIFTFIMLLSVVTISLGSTANQENSTQKVTIIRSNVTLVELLEVIDTETDYDIVYGNYVMSIKDRHDVNYQDKTVAEILNDLTLKWSCSYSISGTSISVFEKRKAEQKQNQTVTGRVIDTETKESIVGASVYVESDPSTGTMTDFDGNYTLEIKVENAVIIFSFIGYETQRIQYAGEKVLDVGLIEDKQLLEELVVVGFSQQKKINVTGSITTVKASELQTSSTQLTNGFAGRLAGVVSVQRSGEPGRNNSDFWIRGISTFSGSNTPLIFMDGVEIHSGGDLNSIDPAIIENFTVLKDASSTALYGARGANGVILITTKTGIVSDKPIIEVKVQNTVNTPTMLPQFTDAVTYMNMANEAVLNSNPNAPQKYTTEQIEGTNKGLDPWLFPNVNWMDELFSKYSYQQYANLNIRGGSEQVQYFSSVSFTNSTGLIKEPQDAENNIGFNRINIQTNLTSRITNSTKLQVNINTNFESKKGPNISSEDLYRSVMYANPVQFPMTFPADAEDGHIRFGAKPGGYWGVFPNPYARLQSGYAESRSTTLTALAKLSQDITWVEGLSADVMVSIKTWSNGGARRWYDPFYYRVDPASITQPALDEYEYDVALIGEGGNTSLRFDSYDDGNTVLAVQPQINYNRMFGKHDVQALLVYNQKDYRVNDARVNGEPSLKLSLPYRNQGLSSRFSYVFDGKYMVEANLGYTGSENFADGNRFGFFPAMSLGYVISNEDYFRNLFGEYIQLLKIRASYGLTGNDQIGDYDRFPYRSEVDLSERLLGYPFGQDFKNYKDGVVVKSYGNNDVTWEESEKLNIGIDTEMFNGVILSVDFFKEHRTGILMQRRIIPSFVGIGEADPIANIGEVKNQGIDLSVNFDKAITPDFIIRGMGTFTFSRNIILAIDEVPGSAEMYPNTTEVGRPVGQIYGLRAANIFTSQEELDTYPDQHFGNYTIGDLRYMNINDDGVVDLNDMVPMGYPEIPEITYGFGVTVRYKKADASIFFQGIARTSIMIGGWDMERKKLADKPDAIVPFMAEFERNVLKFIADDYWSEDNQNPQAAYPRITEGYNLNNDMPSSWWLRDGSFLRLKDIEVGYNINDIMRVYLMGQNLLTFSKFDLWDPEIASTNGLKYPTQKNLTLGLQFNL